MRKIVTIVYALVATSCLAQEPISDSTSYGACIMQNGSIVGINEDKPFAMHSVMKFPQALYCDEVPASFIRRRLPESERVESR